MKPKKTVVYFLRAMGLLLIALGLVHLAATPHIPALLGAAVLRQKKLAEPLPIAEYEPRDLGCSDE